LQVSFEAAGLRYSPPPECVPRSLKALQLTELARDLGRHEAVHDRLMDAYWAESRDIGDPDVLRGLAAELELPTEHVERVLAGDAYVDRIGALTQRALSIGANGVPAWLLAGKLLILGAQPRELFEEAFAQLGAGAR
jgi:predicted DsbA family dithiol-disulfide isomerase